MLRYARSAFSWKNFKINNLKKIIQKIQKKKFNFFFSKKKKKFREIFFPIFFGYRCFASNLKCFANSFPTSAGINNILGNLLTNCVYRSVAGMRTMVKLWAILNVSRNKCQRTLHKMFSSGCSSGPLAWSNQQCFLVTTQSAFWAEAGHILYLRILYPIHIQAQKKDIISYHYHSKKGYGYISYILCKKICQHCHSFWTTKSQTW
jgi:hypothetical protein